jgi:hypothetical protein
LAIINQLLMIPDCIHHQQTRKASPNKVGTGASIATEQIETASNINKQTEKKKSDMRGDEIDDILSAEKTRPSLRKAASSSAEQRTLQQDNNSNKKSHHKKASALVYVCVCRRLPLHLHVMSTVSVLPSFMSAIFLTFASLIIG